MSKSKHESTRTPTTQELKELIKGCRLEFVTNNFKELAELHMKKEKIRALLESKAPDKAKRLRELLYGWPKLYVGNIVWAMTAYPTGDSVSNETDEAGDDTDASSLSHNVLIDLDKKTQSIADQSFDLGLTMVKLSSSEAKSRYLCGDDKDDHPFTVLISTNADGKKHLCLTSYDKEDDVLWAAGNVEEFSMLSVIEKATNGKDATDNKSYTFTCFNKRLNVAFTEVLSDIKDVPLSLDSIEGEEIKEPLKDLLDGCYYYLKNKDIPFTKAQKYFFANYCFEKVYEALYSDEMIDSIISISDTVNKKK